MRYVATVTMATKKSAEEVLADLLSVCPGAIYIGIRPHRPVLAGYQKPTKDDDSAKEVVDSKPGAMLAER